MIIVKLTPEEVAQARGVGQQRNAAKRGLRGNRFCRRYDDEQVHIIGVLGEMAVAKRFGLVPGFHALPGGDGGYDLVINNKTLEVKTRNGPNADLLVYADMADFTADRCVLCWRFTDDMIGIVGHIDRMAFLEKAQLVRGANRKQRLCVRWQDLVQYWPEHWPD